MDESNPIAGKFEIVFECLLHLFAMLNENKANNIGETKKAYLSLVAEMDYNYISESTPTQNLGNNNISSQLLQEWVSIRWLST